mmetsp:Transcript_37027/g.73687  ORF Transcript_37027/g.73687 Transcript_37027/m.73687 type:complete len:320 (+) Transcript_37027:1-960(+)
MNGNDPLLSLNMTVWRAQGYSIGGESKLHATAPGRFAFLPRVRQTPHGSVDSVAFGGLLFDGHVRIISLPLAPLPEDCPNSAGIFTASINYGMLGLGAVASSTAINAFALHKEIVTRSPGAAFYSASGFPEKYSIFVEGLKSILSSAERAVDKATSTATKLERTSAPAEPRKRPRAVSFASSSSGGSSPEPMEKDWPEAVDDEGSDDTLSPLSESSSDSSSEGRETEGKAADAGPSEGGLWAPSLLESGTMESLPSVDGQGVQSFVADIGAASLAAVPDERCSGGSASYMFRRMGPLMLWKATFDDELSMSVLLAPERA